jgi:Lar family restriction alleviation protein
MIRKIDPIPCPFCGSAAGFVEMMDLSVYRFQCDGCAALGPPVERGDYEGAGCPRAERDATKAWNRRKRAGKS